MNSTSETNLRPELSIVIPIFNSAEIIPELYRRLVATLEPVASSFEIIAVLDGCQDNSFDVISKFALKDNRVKVVEFSRNFGHQAAITAGLEFALGTMVGIMDDDLEDPPEALPEFIAKIKDGFDVVYGIRRRRKRFILYRFLYNAFYRLLGKLASVEIPFDAGDFCVMKDNVVRVLNSMPESNRYLRGLRAWSGFNQVGIEYNRRQRFSGTSGYGLKKYFMLAFDGIFSFSYKPLRYMATMGAFIALISFILGTRLIILKLLGKVPDVPGWASLLVSIFFLSGVQLVSIGIIGEYISRVYDEAKQRPKYVIRRSIGIHRFENYERPKK